MEGKKVTIEIFRKKDAEGFSAAIADPDSRADTGSAMAAVAACSAALLHRASVMCKAAWPENEKLEYLIRNSEILRTYMVNLIDEDVKCRGPLRRALKEGDARSIEAGRQTGVSICAEIIHMMQTDLDLALELIPFVDLVSASYLKESAELAFSAAKGCIPYILMMGSYSSDDTYRFVIKRENELNMKAMQESHQKILDALSAFPV